MRSSFAASVAVMVLLALGTAATECPTDLDVAPVPPTVTMSRNDRVVVNVANWTVARADDPASRRLVSSLPASFYGCMLVPCGVASSPIALRPLAGCEANSPSTIGDGLVTKSGCFKTAPADDSGFTGSIYVFARCVSGEGATWVSRPATIRIRDTRPVCTDRTVTLVSDVASADGELRTTLLMPAVDPDGDVLSFLASGVSTLSGSIAGCTEFADVFAPGANENQDSFTSLVCSKWVLYAETDELATTPVVETIRYTAPKNAKEKPDGTVLDRLSFAARDDLGEACRGNVTFILRRGGTPTIVRLSPGSESFASRRANEPLLLATRAELSAADPEGTGMTFTPAAHRTDRSLCVRVCNPAGIAGLRNWVLAENGSVASAPDATGARCVADDARLQAYSDPDRPRQKYSVALVDFSRCAAGDVVSAGVSVVTSHASVSTTLRLPNITVTEATPVAAPGSDDEACAKLVKDSPLRLVVPSDAAEQATVPTYGCALTMLSAGSCDPKNFLVQTHDAGSDNLRNVAPFNASAWPADTAKVHARRASTAPEGALPSCTIVALAGRQALTVTFNIATTESGGDAPTTTTTTTTTPADTPATTTAAPTPAPPPPPPPPTTAEPAPTTPAPTDAPTPTAAVTDAAPTTTTAAPQPPAGDSPTTSLVPAPPTSAPAVTTTTASPPATTAPATTAASSGPTSAAPSSTTTTAAATTAAPSTSKAARVPSTVAPTTQGRAVNLPMLLLIGVVGFGCYYFRAEIKQFVEEQRNGGGGSGGGNGYEGANSSRRGTGVAYGDDSDEGDEMTPAVAAVGGAVAAGHTAVSMKPKPKRGRALGRKNSEDDGDEAARARSGSGGGGGAGRIVSVKKPHIKKRHDSDDEGGAGRARPSAKRGGLGGIASRAGSGARPVEDDDNAVHPAVAAQSRMATAAPSTAAAAPKSGWDVDDDDWE